MKALILNLLIWIIPLAFAQESTWKKSPIYKIRHSIFNQMTFRQPVVFTPFDVKVGYLYYGGKNYWSQLPYNASDITVNDLPVLLDSTQYPFNPTTTMRLIMPVAEDMKVEIYNLLGQSVAILTSGYKDAGIYNLTWDASDVSSGIYFVKAQADGFTKTQKLMLVK